MNERTKGTIKQTTVGYIYWGQAMVRMFDLKDGRICVATYWPAGIDLYPCVNGRFDSIEAAEPVYARAVEHALRMMTPKQTI